MLARLRGARLGHPSALLRDCTQCAVELTGSKIHHSIDDSGLCSDHIEGIIKGKKDPRERDHVTFVIGTQRGSGSGSDVSLDSGRESLEAEINLPSRTSVLAP